MLAEKVINRLLGIKGNIIDIKFLEDGKLFQCLTPDDQLLSAVNGIFILEEYEMLDNFKLNNFKNGIIVDAGCHVGLFSIKASVYAKKIISIEPHPINFRLFEINLIRNHVENIVPINAALWYKNEIVYLAEEKRSDIHNIIREIQDKKVYEVSTITLADIIKDYGEIDLLKLDIEGAEFDVMLNSSNNDLRKLKSIVGEIHTDKHDNLDDIIKKLRYNEFNVKLYNPPIFCHVYLLDRILRNWKKLKIKDRSILKMTSIVICIIYNIIVCKLKMYIFDTSQNTKILYAYRME